ncbi:MAG: GNAT family N-acetyltransferase [Opitutaceae bacterium]|jgi:N-acetylglutamate synthase-like GNAT family acetyltransferase
MPDLKDRKKRELELAAILLLLFRRYEKQLPSIDWAAFRADLQAEIAKKLSGTYEASFDRLTDHIDVDLKDASKKAGDWAERYSRELAKQIVANTKAAVSEKKADGAEADYAPQFGEDRAEKIAITETTRAKTAGEYGAIGTAVVLGEIDAPDVIWVTARDDRVCPVCRPLNGTSRDVWGRVSITGPPAHPRCRCELRYEMGRGMGVSEAWTDEAREKSAETRARNKKAEEQKHPRSKVVGGGGMVASRTKLNEWKKLSNEIRSSGGSQNAIGEAEAAVMAQGADRVVIRDERGRILGATSILPKEEGSIAIDHFGAVVGGRGVGVALLRHVAADAVRQNAGITLSSSDEARGFYEKYGFKNTDHNNYAMTADEAKELLGRLESSKPTASPTSLPQEKQRGIVPKVLPPGAKWIRGMVGKYYYLNKKMYKVEDPTADNISEAWTDEAHNDRESVGE